MKQRCLNPKHPAYPGYGGITVCKRWRTSFARFVADMGERPAEYSIDRINNDGDYTPTNCRWATRQQQNTNRAARLSRLTPRAAAAAKRRFRKSCRLAQAKRKSPPKICKQCGQPYTHRQGYTAERRKPKFCSRKCYGASMVRPNRTCEFCGVSFHPKQRAEKARFCSIKHAAQFREQDRQRKGDRHPQAKLTAARVRNILAAHAAGASIAVLARQYGITSSGIAGVVHRRTWVHVHDG
jgi:hypothetical protein